MLRGEDRWRGWLIPGAAMVIALALVSFTIISSPRPSPSAPRSSSVAAASPSLLDEHVVVADDDTLEIRLDGSDLVVKRTSGGSTIELARISTTLQDPSPGETPTTSVSSFWVMVCNTAGPSPRRYVFGHIDGRLPLSYVGPDAVGHGAADGLFLFELKAGAIGDQERIVIETADKNGLVGLGGGTFAAAEMKGTKQPSGCFTLG